MPDIHLDTLTGLDYLADDGLNVPRRLGRTEPTGPMALPSFSAHFDPIAEKDWIEIDLFTAFNPPVLDQGMYGSCTGHGCQTAFALTYASQGEDLIRFSPCYLYSLLNGGRDAGSSISQSIAALQKYGICLESTVGPGRIFRSQYNTSQADAEAKNYLLIEAYQIDSPAEKATALQMGFCVSDSVRVGRTYNGLSYRGIQWLAGVDRGPGNHCTVAGGMTKDKSGLWLFNHQNSWTERWGNKGRYFTCADHIETQSYYEGVVYRVVSPGPNAPKMEA